MVARILLVIDSRPQPEPAHPVAEGLAAQVRGILRQEQPGYRVLSADGGEAALAMLRAERPQVALLPLTPPDGGELAMVGRMLSAVPDLKIIVLAPAADRTLAVRAVARGVYEVCREPPERQELIPVIARAFRRWELEAEGRRLESGDAPPTLRALREVTERRALIEALGRSGGNLSATARELGVSRPTLYSLLRQHRIRTED